MSAPFVDIHTHHAELHPEVIAPRMAGIHPYDAAKRWSLPDYTSADVVGEIGLDYSVEVERDLQERLFREQLSIAEKLGKAVVLHTVRSFEPTMTILAKHNLQAVIFHGFIGSVQQAKRCIERGYYLSFSERSLRSSRTREVIATIPIESLFCETDDRADLHISSIYGSVAELRGITIETLAEQLFSNYNKLFGF